MGNIKGWVNVHIDIETKKMYISNKPYSSKEEAELGIFIGSCIEKLGVLKQNILTFEMLFLIKVMKNYLNGKIINNYKKIS